MVRLSKSLRRLLVAVGILAIVGVVAFIGYQQLSETADYAPLIGKWVRPDGGYVLDIKSIDSGGNIKMTYLNPKPINVSKAQANLKSGKIELFIELRDKNYPGNYYTLTFDTESNRLVGVYYHLGLNQNFDVYFASR